MGVYIIIRSQSKKGEDDQSILMFQNQLQELSKTFNTKLGDVSEGSRKAAEHQFSESSKMIRNVTERLTKLDETNKQVVNFADQLQKLQDVLTSPKQRGILGEFYLESLLKNTFTPKQYQMQ